MCVCVAALIHGALLDIQFTETGQFLGHMSGKDSMGKTNKNFSLKHCSAYCIRCLWIRRLKKKRIQTAMFSTPVKIFCNYIKLTSGFKDNVIYLQIVPMHRYKSQQKHKLYMYEEWSEKTLNILNNLLHRYTLLNGEFIGILFMSQ